MKVCPNCGKQYPDDANFCPTDAGRLEQDAGGTHRGLRPAGAPAANEVEVAAIGGRFELVAQLGGGHTGEVYEALDRDTGQPCAVKLVNPAVFPNPLLLQRAERELKQLERLDLSEVARVLAHGRQGDRLWIAMELVSGVEMMQVVVEGGPIPPLAACRLVRQVAHGLAEAAKQGVIHRDLAAKNVLIGDGESVKIINFPIAVPFSDRVQGVAEFLSPEQVEGKPADQRSSIYSLGALLYFAVTGRPPFAGEIDEVHRAHLAHELVRPSHVTAVPEPVEALIMKAMEKASARRFMTLHQMIGELDSILAGALAAGDAMRPAAATGKARMPVGPAQTLVGVAAFQVQPGGHVPMPEPVIAPISAQMPAVGPGGPAGMGQPATVPPPVSVPHPPAMFDPILLEPDPVRPRQMVASGELGGHSAERLAAQAPMPLVAPQPEPMARQPAVIVPTPPVGAPIAFTHGSTGTGKGKKSNKGSALSADSKGKFRETMWFKKGELDEAAAAAAAAAQEGALASDKADALPIEDRYRDDGTLNHHDAERLSLRTGATALNMKALRAEPLARKRVSERYLMGEMRRGRIWVFLFLLAVMGAIGGGIYYLIR